jgi:hypothetical protein
MEREERGTRQGIASFIGGMQQTMEGRSGVGAGPGTSSGGLPEGVRSIVSDGKTYYTRDGKRFFEKPDEVK